MFITEKERQQIREEVRHDLIRRLYAVLEKNKADHAAAQPATNQAQHIDGLISCRLNMLLCELITSLK